MDIIPQNVKLEGLIGKEIKETVTITPIPKYPFEIIDVKPEQEGNIKCTLKSEKSKYILNIENLKKDVSRYFDSLIIKTNSKVRPEIKIKVYGNITDKATVP
ncbi:MAG: hypothetical protein HQK79_08680 [Desulfobacterales bacterium]|nr:hypothetical protein [Desulfobacterales bacterium]